MNVTLISSSEPSQELRAMGIDDAQELVAYCARVSNPANQFNTETSQKLITYLIRHKHWSPLEMVSACLEIVTTRDIARQILRHRSFSFQEFSQRYADPTAGFDETFVLRETRFQDPKNRQNSIAADFSNAQQRQISYQWENMQTRLLTEAKSVYEWAIHKGIAKEQARAVLPEGLTASKLYMNGTIRSWIHFIEMRSGNGTQKEHQQVAVACANVIAKIFPMAADMVAESNSGN